MKISYNGHDIEMYDSIQDLPIGRYEKHATYGIVDSSAGSSLYDIKANVTKAASLIDIDKDQAKQVLQNAQVGIEMIVTSINPELMSFAVLVKSIDGEAHDDISETGIRNTLDKIKKQGWIFTTISNALQAVKKKLQRN